MTTKKMNLQNSNVYNTNTGEGNTTPTGSNLFPEYPGYKHDDLSDCKLVNETFKK